MYAGLHFGVLPYVGVNTSSDPTVAMELSFVTLMTHCICVAYIGIFEASDVVEGLSNIAVRKTVLELLKLVSRVVEYNRRLRGTLDFILQDSTWLCARSLLLVAIAFPESHSELKVCDGFVSLSKRVLIWSDMLLMDVIHNLCGDGLVAAIQTYCQVQDSGSVVELINAMMAWAKAHEFSGCFVNAYLSEGCLPMLKSYP